MTKLPLYIDLLILMGLFNRARREVPSHAAFSKESQAGDVLVVSSVRFEFLQKARIFRCPIETFEVW